MIFKRIKIESSAFAANKLLLIIGSLFIWTVGCRTLPVSENVKFYASPSYANIDSSLIYLNIEFWGTQKKTIVFDWKMLYFQEPCILTKGIKSEKIDKTVLLSMSTCPYEALIFEDSDGNFNTLHNLAFYPTTGPHSGKMVGGYPADIKPDTVFLNNSRAKLSRNTLPIEVLYPVEKSERIRLYYTYTGENNKKVVIRSNWFDCLPLPNSYKSFRK
ncbi:MAG: hypothetical protein KIS77_04990 [Saprospiraceae bacterium]|nr:hypothetical protein [Saprospiraceae bacterium]